MIFINDEKKIIFITTAKCASTSVKNIFLDYSNIESYKSSSGFKAHLIGSHHIPRNDSQIRIDIPVDRDEFKEYLKIQFYRNPYERAVSCYLHHKYGKKEQHTVISKLACSNPDLAESTGKTYENYKCKLKCENFKDFLKLRNKGIRADCLSCYNHSRDQFVTKKIDELINIKHIEKGIERINKKYKINLKNIVYESHSYRKRGYKYKDYLTPENKKLIRKAFKKDFELCKNKNFI